MRIVPIVLSIAILLTASIASAKPPCPHGYVPDDNGVCVKSDGGGGGHGGGCTGICGTDGTPISVQYDAGGHIAAASGTGNDGVTRSLNFYPSPFLYIQWPDGNTNGCVPDDQCGCINASGYCYPTILGGCNSYGGSFLPMSTCSQYPDNFMTESKLQYSDSAGNSVLVRVQMAPRQSAARVVISNSVGWLDVAVINGTNGVMRASSGAAQSFYFDPNADFPPSINAAVGVQFPELAQIQYFNSLLVKFYDLAGPGFSLPPPPSSPGWFRYLGDGVIGLTFGIAGTILVTEGLPLIAVVVGAAAVAGIDIWQNESRVRDRAWEAIINPLCNAARTFDELDGEAYWGPSSSVGTLHQQLCP